MNKTEISAPWYTYRRMVNAMFEGDEEVTVGEVYKLEGKDGADYAFDVEISDHEKYVAMDRLLCKEKQFGSVNLQIRIRETNVSEQVMIDLYSKMFAGNMLLKDIKEICDPAGVHHVYLIFWPAVVQFYNDNLDDYNGNWSGLAEDIARKIFVSGCGGIHFCTSSYRENSDFDPQE